MNFPKVDGVRCKKCHGYGLVREMRKGAAGLTAKIVRCDRCNGSRIEPKKRGKK